MILRLPRATHASLVAVARHASPREACGFLLGRCDDDQMIAEEVVPTLNAAVVQGGFAIPDIEVRRVTYHAVRAELALIAIYHSHASGAIELSAGDIHALNRSRYLWLVIAPSTGTVAAYRPNGERLILKLGL